MTATQTAAPDASDLPRVGSDGLDHDCSGADRCSHDDPDQHPDQQHAGGSWLQRRVTAAIVFYQRAREGKPSPCRFFPSCSAYALEAVEVHGSWRGGWLSVRRLLRCRPLGPSGFDPVPEPRVSTSSDSPPSTPVQKGG